MLVLIGLLLPVGVVRAAPPAAALAAENSSLCPAGDTWVDMDDPKRHPAALNRAALGLYDANGDAQICAWLVEDQRAANLRVAYKVLDLGESKAAGAQAGCPADYGQVDMSKPESIPFPLSRDILMSYDRNGDGQMCVSQPLRDEIADLALGLQVVEPPLRIGWCGGQPATITGTGGDDTIYGTLGDDVIAGLGGHDRIYGEGGDDIICGDAGDDRIISSSNGVSLLYGGPDSDYLFASGTDRLYGNGGGDDLYGSGETHDLLDGGPDNDWLSAATLAQHDDPCPSYGTTMYGGGGDDWMEGGCGADFMSGDADNDHLDGEAVAHKYSAGDVIGGGDGDDELYGGRSDDLLNGGDGDDMLLGWEGGDLLYGGDGYDTLDGYWGDDDLYGGRHDDNLSGGGDDDVLDGGQGDDNLYGNEGEDTLYGDNIGSDLLDGGGGSGDIDWCISSSSSVAFVDCEQYTR
jgi:hypothetical protein